MVNKEVVIKTMRIDKFANEIGKMKTWVFKMVTWGAPAFQTKAEVVEPGNESEKAEKWDVIEGKGREESLSKQMGEQ